MKNVVLLCVVIGCGILCFLVGCGTAPYSQPAERPYGYGDTKR